MNSRDRRWVLVLVVIIVIAAGALCALHTHDDVLDLCAQALVIAGVAVMAALWPGWRFVPAFAPVFPGAILELTSPPPRN